MNDFDLVKLSLILLLRGCYAQNETNMCCDSWTHTEGGKRITSISSSMLRVGGLDMWQTIMLEWQAG